MPRTRGQKTEVEQVQSYTDEKVARAVPPWIADGSELRGVAIQGSFINRVPHKLGRRLSGWMVQRITTTGGGNVQISERPGTDDKILYLLNNGPDACTVDLWVW